jgi:hypothetical protein
MPEERDPNRVFREGLVARLKATRSPGRGLIPAAPGEPLDGPFTKPQTATEAGASPRHAGQGGGGQR